MTRRSKWRLAASVLTAAAFAEILVAGRADAGDETVRLAPSWKVGEKVGYEIVRTRRKSLPDKPVNETGSRSSVEIEVLSAGMDTYVLAWTHGETRFEPDGKGEDELARKMADLVKGVRIVLDVDSDGNITGVQNWKDVQETMTKAAGVLCDELTAKGTDPAVVAKVGAQAKAQFAGKAQVEQGCTQDPRRLFMALGYEFEDGKPVEYEDRLPNPFGGEAFPAKARVAVRSVDGKAGIATVDFTQTIPPQDAVRIMDKTLKDLAERMGKPVPDTEGLKSFSIEDSAEFKVELASGWMQSVTHKRVTKAGASSQEDVVTFTRKAGPPGSAPAEKRAPDDPDGKGK